MPSSPRDGSKLSQACSYCRRRKVKCKSAGYLRDTVRSLGPGDGAIPCGNCLVRILHQLSIQLNSSTIRTITSSADTCHSSEEGVRIIASTRGVVGGQSIPRKGWPSTTPDGMNAARMTSQHINHYVDLARHKVCASCSSAHKFRVQRLVLVATYRNRHIRCP